MVCQVNIHYHEYEYVIFQNCLNLDFLAKVRENIGGNLYKLAALNSHFVCEIINEKCQYQNKDWFTGRQLFFDLKDCLLRWEQKKLIKF